MEKWVGKSVLASLLLATSAATNAQGFQIKPIQPRLLTDQMQVDPMKGWTKVTDFKANAEPSSVKFVNTWLLVPTYTTVLGKQVPRSMTARFDLAKMTALSAWVDSELYGLTVDCREADTAPQYPVPRAHCLTTNAAGSVFSHDVWEELSGKFRISFPGHLTPPPGGNPHPTIMGKPTTGFANYNGTAGDVQTVQFAAWNGSNKLMMIKRKLGTVADFATGKLSSPDLDSGIWPTSNFYTFGHPRCDGGDALVACAVSDGVGDGVTVFTTSVGKDETNPRPLAQAAVAPPIPGKGANSGGGIAVTQVYNGHFLLLARGANTQLYSATFNPTAKTITAWRAEGGLTPVGTVPHCRKTGIGAACFFVGKDGFVYGKLLTTLPR